MEVNQFDYNMVGKKYRTTRDYGEAKIVWVRDDLYLATIEYYDNGIGCNTQIAIPFQSFKKSFVKWISEV